jgi:hypothetical protein
VVPAVAVLIVAGFHFPVTGVTLVELTGSNGAFEFWHNGSICTKVGVISGTISTSILNSMAHRFASGVKVYVTVPGVAVLIVAGFHVPEIGVAFVELVGSKGAVELWHNGPILAKVGVINGSMVMFIVTGSAH